MLNLLRIARRRTSVQRGGFQFLRLREEVDKCYDIDTVDLLTTRLATFALRPMMTI